MFHTRPQSSRSTSPLAENAASTPPQGSETIPLNAMSSVIGFVTLRTVRSPVMRPRTPLHSTLVLLNVIVGYFSTSKKSGDFRCPSRSAMPVLTVAVSIEISTCRLVRVLGDDDGAREAGEPATDLREDEVAADELDRGVRGVDGPDAGAGGLDADDTRCVAHDVLLPRAGSARVWRATSRPARRARYANETG